jgi:hypothetical protein
MNSILYGQKSVSEIEFYSQLHVAYCVECNWWSSTMENYEQRKRGGMGPRLVCIT